MSAVVFTLLVFSFIGTLGARRPDIDINRIKLLPKESRTLHYRVPNYHNRRSIITNNNYIGRNYDNVHDSSRGADIRAPVHLLHDTSSSSEAKTYKVHQPREDPRNFYQSDAYIKENNGKNLNNEVSSVYLGRGEVRGGAENYRPLPILWRDNEINSIGQDNICVRCPHDRTLIIKAGLDRALLHNPQLTTCSGHKPPRGTRFVQMYGPKFGALLKEGSHIVVGRITYEGETLRTCKMQIHVLTQTCPVPKYLVPNCGDQNKTCSFNCRSSRAEIRGHETLTCGADNRWSGRLPTCSVQTWCSPPPTPQHGKLACQGSTASNGWGLAEGARCRARCAQGWNWSPRATAICRRGLWTRELSCQPHRAQ